MGDREDIADYTLPNYRMYELLREKDHKIAQLESDLWAAQQKLKDIAGLYHILSTLDYPTT